MIFFVIQHGDGDPFGRVLNNVMLWIANKWILHIHGSSMGGSSTNGVTPCIDHLIPGFIFDIAGELSIKLN